MTPALLRFSTIDADAFCLANNAGTFGSAQKLGNPENMTYYTYKGLE